jgi:hypothetical protein
MKFRVVIVLVAGSFLGLAMTTIAQTNTPEFRITEFTEEWDDHWIVNCDGQILLDRWMNTGTLYFSLTNIIEDQVSGNAYCQPNCGKRWHSIRWSGLGVPGQRSEWGYGIPFEPCTPFSTNNTVGAFSTNRLKMEQYYSTGSDINGDGTDGLYAHWSYEARNISLSTGGEVGKTNMNLVRVCMVVQDKGVSGWPTVPAKDFVTIQGRSPDTNEVDGSAYWDFFQSDHTAIDVTPSVAGEWLHNEFWPTAGGGTHEREFIHLAFAPSVQKARPRIWWGGTDATDKTNVVWVGEKMDLECRLTIWPAVTITNFLACHRYEGQGLGS